MVSKCPCPICVRSRAFTKHLNSIESEEARKYFENLYEHIHCVEEDLEIQKIYLSNLKTLYPKVYKEISTLRKLKPEESNYPESFL